MKTASIGVFDSGFGGLTVLKAITSLLPQESISYFADTAHLPYGNKTKEQIIEYSSQSIEFLAEKGIKLLVIACHTSCVTSFKALEKKFSFPIIGIADSGIKALISQEKTEHLAFLGTQTTVSSGFYQQKIQEKLPLAKVTGVACPLFVPLVESGYVNNPLLMQSTVQEELRSLKKCTPSLSAVLLACTHYPLLMGAIQKELGPHIHLIDPSESCAKEVQKTLQELNLQNYSSHPPQHQFYVSDNPTKFHSIGKLFLPSLLKPTLCPLEPSSCNCQ